MVLCTRGYPFLTVNVIPCTLIFPLALNAIFAVLFSIFLFCFFVFLLLFLASLLLHQCFFMLHRASLLRHLAPSLLPFLIKNGNRQSSVPGEYYIYINILSKILLCSIAITKL